MSARTGRRNDMPSVVLPDTRQHCLRSKPGSDLPIAQVAQHFDLLLELADPVLRIELRERMID